MCFCILDTFEPILTSNRPTSLRTRIVLNRAPIVHGSVYQFHDFLDA